MASLASAKITVPADALVFGPERDVPLSKSGLRHPGASDMAFQSDPLLARWTPAPEEWNIKIAGYPQRELIADGLIALPTFFIEREGHSIVPSSLYLRVCLIVTTSAYNYFHSHPVMLTVPLVRHRCREPLYGPATETLSVSNLRDGGRKQEQEPEEEEEKEGEDKKKKKRASTRKRGGLHEIIAIWAPNDPATFAVQICHGEPDGSMEWAHPDVLMTMAFRHKRPASQASELKKARKAKQEEGAAEVLEALIEEAVAKAT